MGSNSKRRTQNVVNLRLPTVGSFPTASYGICKIFPQTHPSDLRGAMASKVTHYFLNALVNFHPTHRTMKIHHKFCAATWSTQVHWLHDHRCTINEGAGRSPTPCSLPMLIKRCCVTDACPFYIRVCYFENLTNNFITNEVSKKTTKSGCKRVVGRPWPHAEKVFPPTDSQTASDSKYWRPIRYAICSGAPFHEITWNATIQRCRGKKMGRSTRTNNATLLLAKICSMWYIFEFAFWWK